MFEQGTLTVEEKTVLSWRFCCEFFAEDASEGQLNCQFLIIPHGIVFRTCTLAAVYIMRLLTTSIVPPLYFLYTELNLPCRHLLRERKGRTIASDASQIDRQLYSNCNSDKTSVVVFQNPSFHTCCWHTKFGVQVRLSVAKRIRCGGGREVNVCTCSTAHYIFLKKFWIFVPVVFVSCWLMDVPRKMRSNATMSSKTFAMLCYNDKHWRFRWIQNINDAVSNVQCVNGGSSTGGRSFFVNIFRKPVVFR